MTRGGRERAGGQEMRHIANMEQEVKGEERAITHNSMYHMVDLLCTYLGLRGEFKNCGNWHMSYHPREWGGWAGGRREF